jgi:hypothetical protein
MFVLTIDQESSRTAGDRVDDFLELLSDAVAAHVDALVRPFERTVGDEVQGLMSSADLAVELALVALRTGKWQVGIGAGRVDEPVPASTRAATGEAFLHAREAVERARSRSRSVPLAVSGSDPAAARDAESVLRLIGAVAERRTSAGWAAIDALRASPERPRQEDIAAGLGITQQAVSQRLKTARWAEEIAARPLAAALLIRAEGAGS